MRPLLLPTLSRLWRDATTLQLGADPERAVVLTAVDPGVAAFLISLDGRRSLRDVVAAPPPGLAGAAAESLITALIARGAVVDADTLTPRVARDADATLPPLPPALVSALLTHGSHAVDRMSARRRAHVLVRCRGRVGPVIAALLAADGVGRVVVTGTGVATPDDVTVGGLCPDDVGRPYVLATLDAVRRGSPAVDTRPTGELPDFVVLAAGPLPLPADQVRWTSAGVPHLPVLLRDGVAIVGPLVAPGRTACLTCLDEHRRDRDPAWPVLAAQLATDRRGEPAEAVVVTTAAALAAAEVSGHLEGVLTATVGTSLEIGPPGVPLRRRSWTPHPRCDCLRDAGAATTDDSERSARQ
ncbi:TOMM precursor leader peptide-binding protein [Cryptosporangium aurantiacum]|uniref:Bacteriocin biosynthesis cyclodehydratase domain-containing protein n=1 Tax=Cryptosporangium aurantiacum TaxID=134849 RepID=A0A1M7QNB4_9ACTN|nr:TOMM precursor leader peptide-binding protein [Cryptosporangium aurantiacum]SHN32845.1 bacteriocin biosynthesis cyclodehydratase domain-containing protein [Cryptosporangium aurantiacum]